MKFLSIKLLFSFYVVLLLFWFHYIYGLYGSFIYGEKLRNFIGLPFLAVSLAVLLTASCLCRKKPFSTELVEKLKLSYIILLSFVLRVLRLFLIQTTPTRDYAIYHDRAMSILQGKGFSVNNHPTAFFPPGYSAFLAFFYRIFGSSYIIGQWVNLILSIGIVYLTYKIATKLFSETIAAIASFFVAVLPSQILFSGILCTEILYTFLLLVIMYMMTDFMISANLSFTHCILLGILTGLNTFVRPHSLFVIPVFIGYYMYINKHRLENTVGKFLTVLLFLSLTICPYLIRNYRIYKTFVPISTTSGIQLFEGNMNPDYPHYNPWDWELFFRSTDDEIRSYKNFRYAAIEYITSHPLTFMKNGIKKLFHVLVGDSYGVFWSFTDTVGAPSIGEFKHTVKYLIFVTELFYSLLFALYIISLVFSRRLSRSHNVLNIIILPFLLIYFVYYGKDRFHFPFIPVFAIYGSYSFHKLFFGEDGKYEHASTAFRK